MGYTAPETKRYGFQLSTDLINSNDTTVQIDDTGLLIQTKQYTLGLDIFTLSEINVQYDHRVTSSGSGELITSYLYHNTTLLDTETHNDTAWENVSNDLTGINWTKGDTITLKHIVANVAPVYKGEVKNFRIYASNTPFYDTS